MDCGFRLLNYYCFIESSEWVIHWVSVCKWVCVWVSIVWLIHWVSVCKWVCVSEYCLIDTLSERVCDTVTDWVTEWLSDWVTEWLNDWWLTDGTKFFIIILSMMSIVFFHIKILVEVQWIIFLNVFYMWNTLLLGCIISTDCK